MGYSTEIQKGYGIFLGEGSDYGYGKSDIWTGPLKKYTNGSLFSKLLSKEYPLLSEEAAGDTTFESISYLVVSSAHSKDEPLNPEALKQLDSFIESFGLDAIPDWHEWTVRW